MPPLYVLSAALISSGGLLYVLARVKLRAERRQAEAAAEEPAPPIAPPPLPAAMPDLLLPKKWPRPEPSLANDFRNRFPPLPVPSPTSGPMTPSGRYQPPPLPEPQKLTNADLRSGQKALAGLKRQGHGPNPPPPAAPISISARVTTTITRPSAAPAKPRRAPSPAAHPLRGTKYLLTYGDAFGEVSERKIRLERVTEDNECLRLHAYCYLRKEKREFRSDRIITIEDLETGTLIGNPEAYFSGWH